MLGAAVTLFGILITLARIRGTRLLLYRYWREVEVTRILELLVKENRGYRDLRDKFSYDEVQLLCSQGNSFIKGILKVPKKRFRRVLGYWWQLRKNNFTSWFKIIGGPSTYELTNAIHLPISPPAVFAGQSVSYVSRFLGESTDEVKVNVVRQANDNSYKRKYSDVARLSKTNETMEDLLNKLKDQGIRFFESSHLLINGEKVLQYKMKLQFISENKESLSHHVEKQTILDDLNKWPFYINQYIKNFNYSLARDYRFIPVSDNLEIIVSKEHVVKRYTAVLELTRIYHQVKNALKKGTLREELESKLAVTPDDFIPLDTVTQLREHSQKVKNLKEKLNNYMQEFDDQYKVYREKIDYLIKQKQAMSPSGKDSPQKNIKNITKNEAEEFFDMINQCDDSVIEELFPENFQKLTHVEKYILSSQIKKKLHETLVAYLEKYNEYLETKVLINQEISETRQAFDATYRWHRKMLF